MLKGNSRVTGNIAANKHCYSPQQHLEIFIMRWRAGSITSGICSLNCTDVSINGSKSKLQNKMCELRWQHLNTGWPLFVSGWRWDSCSACVLRVSYMASTKIKTRLQTLHKVLYRNVAGVLCGFMTLGAGLLEELSMHTYIHQHSSISCPFKIHVWSLCRKTSPWFNFKFCCVIIWACDW